MSAYRYRGYDENGREVTGEILAANLDEVEARLKGQRVILVVATPTGKAVTKPEARSNDRANKGKSVSDADMAVLLNNLGTMVRAGVPFVEALDALLMTLDKPHVLNGVAAVREQIVAGASLSDALGPSSHLFPDMVGDMVRVAEEGGRLDEALLGAAKHFERSADLKRKVVNAMMYPCVMLGVSGITIIALILFVLPRFAEVFVKLHTELPVTTRLMLSAGELVRAKPWLAGGSIGFSLICIVLASQNLRFRRIFGSLMARVPGIGDLLRKLALSRALQSISTLLNSNVSIVKALEHGANVAGNEQLRIALLRCVGVIQDGGSLTQGCQETRAFPPMLVQIISIGERTGKLSEMLSTCAERMEIETDAKLRSLVALLEPLLIAGMGLVVGVITVSIVTPIYSTIQNVR